MTSNRADVYGKYSLGSGAILSEVDQVWSDLADPLVLAEYETSMRRDMLKSGIPIETFSNWKVMDVGTGRQALTFLEFGAFEVSHFDISPENVSRVDAFRKANGLEKRLTTTCCDLVQTDLGTDRFDFIYLNGIVQHFSNVGLGVTRCMRALKPGGLLWLYFYRSGTFDNFVLYMLRVLANGSNTVTNVDCMKEYFINSLITFSEDARRNYMSSIFMDGVFTKNAQLFTVDTYTEFARQCGFEIVSSSGIDPVGKDVDHYYARAATVVTLKKVREVDDMAPAARLLSPQVAVNQLDPSHYSEPEILKSIELYCELAERLTNPALPPSIRPAVVMRLFHLLAHKTRQPAYDVLQRHVDLQACITAINEALKAEY